MFFIHKYVFYTVEPLDTDRISWLESGCGGISYKEHVDLWSSIHLIKIFVPGDDLQWQNCDLYSSVFEHACDEWFWKRSLENLMYKWCVVDPSAFMLQIYFSHYGIIVQWEICVFHGLVCGHKWGLWVDSGLGRVQCENHVDPYFGYMIQIHVCTPLERHASEELWILCTVAMYGIYNLTVFWIGSHVKITCICLQNPCVRSMFLAPQQSHVPKDPQLLYCSLWVTSMTSMIWFQEDPT